MSARLFSGSSTVLERQTPSQVVYVGFFISATFAAGVSNGTLLSTAEDSSFPEFKFTIFALFLTVCAM